MLIDTRVARTRCEDYREMTYYYDMNYVIGGNYQNDTGCRFWSVPVQSSLDTHKALSVVRKIAGRMLDGDVSVNPSEFNDGFCVFIPMLIECSDHNKQPIDDAHGVRVEIHDMLVGHRLAQCDVLVLNDRLALLTKTVDYAYALNPVLLRVDKAVVQLPVDDDGNVKAGIWRTTVDGVQVVACTERFGDAFVRFVLSRPVDKHNAWKMTTYVGVKSFMIEVESRDTCRALRFSAPWQSVAERKAAREWIHTLIACYRRVSLVEQRLRWLMGDDAVDELITPLCTISGRTVYRQVLCTDWMQVAGATGVDDEVADVAKAVAAERLGLVKDYETVAGQPDAKCVKVGNDGVVVKVDKSEYVFVDTQWARIAVDECVQRGLYAQWLINRAQRVRHDAENVRRATMELVG